MSNDKARRFQEMWEALPGCQAVVDAKHCGLPEIAHWTLWHPYTPPTADETPQGDPMTTTRTPRVDLTGQRFGRLTASGKWRLDEKNGRRKWECICDCGGSTWTYAQRLRSGRSQSCGCFKRDRLAEHNRATKSKSGIPGQLTYKWLHKRLRLERGPASDQPCVDCGSPAYDWSYDGLDPNQQLESVNGYVLSYSSSTSHYVARCRACHRRHDLLLSNQTKETQR